MKVFYRVGGLESEACNVCSHVMVFYRLDGLERNCKLSPSRHDVFYRVGGLESKVKLLLISVEKRFIDVSLVSAALVV